METCSEVSACETAGTTSSTSSWMKPPPPAFPSVRCVLRYAEFAYGSSTVSVNRFPCESFSSERTSDVICPAVLYADEPTTGILVSRRQRRFLQIGCDADNGVDQGGGGADAKCRANSRLQIEVLGIDADRR